jgi:hypothetical protein
MKVRVEDHSRGRPLLAAYSAHVEPHPEVKDLAYLVRGHQPWPNWVEGFCRFALGPLSTALGLEGAFADIVGYHNLRWRPGHRLPNPDSWSVYRSRHPVRLPSPAWSSPAGCGHRRMCRQVCWATSGKVLARLVQAHRSLPRGRCSSSRCTGSDAGGQSERRSALQRIPVVVGRHSAPARPRPGDSNRRCRRTLRRSRRPHQRHRHSGCRRSGRLVVQSRQGQWSRRPQEVAVRPYHSWGNRGPTTMRVCQPTNRN